MLALADMGLLKSDELYSNKYQIEDFLQACKSHLSKVEALKVEKAVPRWRMAYPKSGVFLTSNQAVPELNPLRALLQEIIQTNGGSELVAPVELPELEISGSTINQAIKDAKILLETQGATSALDRVHTVLHGYLKQACKNAGIKYPEDATLNQLMNILKSNHPALVVRDAHIDSILKSMANILDKLNPLRNNASLAHSNEKLLEHDEALFAINTVNTLLCYLNAKLNKNSILEK